MIIVSFLQELMTKSNKNQWLKPSHERQKGSPKDVQPTGTKERRELVPLMVGSYLNLQEPKNNCERIGNTLFCDNN